MLGTYFTLILALFIVMVVGAVLGYSGDLDTTIKKPLKEALSKYKDDVTDQTNPLFAYKAAWNKVQQEVSKDVGNLVLIIQTFLVEMLWC